jgi:hypothetical protein
MRARITSLSSTKKHVLVKPETDIQLRPVIPPGLLPESIKLFSPSFPTFFIGNPSLFLFPHFCP